MSEGSLVSQNALIIKDLRVVSACNLSYRSACGQSYYDVVENLKQSRIEEDVLCYEGLGDFKLEGCKLIENRPLRDEIFDKYSFDRIIVIFSLLDSPNEGIRFLGKYKIDKEESVRNKHLSFELCETRLELE